MAKLINLALLLVLVCAPISVIQAADEPAPAAVPDNKGTTTVIPDTTTTTAPETTTSTTTTTTTTTPAPETTTTEKTTTTSTTTSTTTPATTTTHAPPTPPGPPDSNHWAVKNETKFCLLVDMAVQVNVTYKTTDGKMSTFLYDLPKSDKLSYSKCKENISEIKVKTDNANFSLVFLMNTTTKQYTMQMGIALNVTDEIFPNAVPQVITMKGEFDDAVPQGKSYHCNRPQMLNVTESIVLENDTATAQGVVTMSKVQWQAFHDRDSEGYDLAKDCDAIDTPDIVPIAVGCALAGLVVIVLLGYLVGRRRSQNRGGYLAM